MSKGFKDTTDLMVCGHEGWLEPSTTHVHPGDTVRLYFNWGHNMVSDGLARKEGLSAFCLSPEGGQEDMSISDEKELCYVFDFVPKTQGVYHFVCKYVGAYAIDGQGNYHQGSLKDFPDAKSATLYTQFSHLSLLVGHHMPEKGNFKMPELDLRLVPEAWQTPHVGDELSFNLQQGLRPLPDTQVMMTHAPDSGGDVTYQGFKSDEQGYFHVKIEESGRYLLIARHHSRKAVSDLYTESSLTYTTFFPVKN